MLGPESLYYYYSTIAAVLAGGISILGAFVLFMLQNINGKIQQKGHAFSGLFKHDFERELKRALDADDYDGYDRMVDQFHGMKGSYKPNLKSEDMELQILNMQSLFHLKKQKGLIIKDLKTSVPLCGSLLVFSVIMIPVSDLLKNYEVISLIGVILSVWWLITCILLLGKVIREAIK
ncbi:MAG: hypothetical protein NTX03_14925 [Bacteroidetes bacterium]|nr:hypothetical protein [Bacteroidota bacterium]